MGTPPRPGIGQDTHQHSSAGGWAIRLTAWASDGACQWPQGELPFRAVDSSPNTTGFPLAAPQAGRATTPPGCRFGHTGVRMPPGAVLVAHAYLGM